MPPNREGPAAGTAPSAAATGQQATGQGVTGQRAERGVPRTRTGAAFKTLVAGAIVLILLLVFILENTESVKISYFGAGGHLPLGVALLIAAIGGALLVGIVGTARIMQLRHHVKRVHKTSVPAGQHPA
jgi:uncharacterized integral membrane protein